MSYALGPELLAIVSSLPEVDVRDVDRARRVLSEQLDALPAPDLVGLEVSDHEVRGDGGHAIALRVYRPLSTGGSAVIYDVHGGASIVGDLTLNHRRNCVLSRELGVCVVAVDYRLAREARYPAGLEVVQAGLEWIIASAPALGVDPAQILLHGQRAGAGLCAALALRLRDRGRPAPAPARAEDLRDLPLAYISVAEFDPMRDEGLDYAARLLRAGVGVELHLFPGTFHGSSLTDSGVSRRELEEELTVLRAVIARLET